MIKNNLLKIFTISCMLASLIKIPSAQAADESPSILWSAFYEALYSTNSNIYDDLLERILLKFESNIASGRLIRLQDFFDKCHEIASLDDYKTITEDDCKTITNEVVRKHNKRVEHTFRKCSDIVKQELISGRTGEPALEYISRKSFAYEQYQKALDEYNIAVQTLATKPEYDDNAYDDNASECQTLKSQSYKYLQDELVARNLFIQNLDGTALNVIYTISPDLQSRLDDARDEVLDKIGSEYILLDDVECKGTETSETIDCFIEPVYGTHPISIRVITGYVSRGIK